MRTSDLLVFFDCHDLLDGARILTAAIPDVVAEPVFGLGASAAPQAIRVRFTGRLTELNVLGPGLFLPDEAVGLDALLRVEDYGAVLMFVWDVDSNIAIQDVQAAFSAVSRITNVVAVDAPSSGAEPYVLWEAGPAER